MVIVIAIVVCKKNTKKESRHQHPDLKGLYKVSAGGGLPKINRDDVGPLCKGPPPHVEVIPKPTEGWPLDPKPKGPKHCGFRGLGFRGLGVGLGFRGLGV